MLGRQADSSTRGEGLGCYQEDPTPEGPEDPHHLQKNWSRWRRKDEHELSAVPVLREGVLASHCCPLLVGEVEGKLSRVRGGKQIDFRSAVEETERLEHMWA